MRVQVGDDVAKQPLVMFRSWPYDREADVNRRILRCARVSRVLYCLPNQRFSESYLVIIELILLGQFFFARVI